MQNCLQILVLVSLLHTTSSTVYYVIPDDHYTTNNNTYTLQHYLNNTNKYFTSHTQLHFLPGQYYLNTDLIIQHISNLSLIGNRTDEVINSVIKCTSPAGIVVVGSSNIVIANIVMNECGNDYNYLTKKYRHFSSKKGHITSLLTLNSASITVKYFYSPAWQKLCGIQFINVWGNVTFQNFTTFNLALWYSGEPRNDIFNTTRNIFITHFQSVNISESVYSVNIQQYNTLNDLMLFITYTNFISRPALYMYHYKCSGQSTLTVENCNFSERNFRYIDSAIRIRYEVYKGKYAIPNTIVIMKCNFSSNTFAGVLLDIYGDVYKHHSNFTQIIPLLVSVSDCNFQNNDSGNICQINYYNYFTTCTENNLPLLSLINVSFFNNRAPSVIHAKCTTVYIEKVVISKVANFISIIAALEEGRLIIHKYCEISESQALTAFSAHKIILKEVVVLNFTSNNLNDVFISGHISDMTTTVRSSIKNDPNIFKECVIQYTSKQGNLDKNFEVGDTLNYSIIVQSNHITQFDDDKMAHCGWENGSAFFSSIPLHVMKKVVNFRGNQIKQPSVLAARRTVCFCHMNKPMCNKEEFGPIFPGQKVNFSFIMNQNYYDKIFNVRNTLSQPLESHLKFVCNTTGSIILINSTNCTTIPYTINYMYSNNKWCELFILIEKKRIYQGQGKYALIDKYTILLQPCPPGFSLLPQGYCQCDPILSSYLPSLTTCDIDHQTIPRLANTWISAHTINNSHSYHVSLHCPFDYCLPYSSHLNLSIPDSQCQFNRSGVLCGQCQHGLSTVFGSSQCKHCSNGYVLLLIPFFVAGILVIVCMFAFNITTTKGNINGFLFYVNILSINESVILSHQNNIINSIISLVNLNLGIETCFYNGMNDYAKMWLQLVFPIYLIFIATLLIITSRYSNAVQRLTAHRALPVLATLFLLSYTKVLLTVSNVLFSYTSITHLPSNHTKLVWSVDANVPFKVKFITLFIASLVFFIMLFAFTAVLTCNKILLHFRLVTNHIKPIIDAFQCPYKKNMYCWTGFYLIIRMVFWGLSFLNVSTNLMISAILLVLIICLQEKMSPYVRKENNFMEILLLLNLYSIFVIASTCGTDTIVITILVLLALFQVACQLIWETVCSSICFAAWKQSSFIIRKYLSVKSAFVNLRREQQQEISLQNTEPF